jgi:CRISPR-associated protein Cmr5
MNRVEELIPRTMEVLKNGFKDGEIEKEYNGYISSFGASVLMSGLKASVAMFESENSSAQADRRKLMNIILQILDERATKDDKLLDYILRNSDKEEFLKKEILNIATALKLCIRTFKFKESEK